MIKLEQDGGSRKVKLVWRAGWILIYHCILSYNVFAPPGISISALAQILTSWIEQCCLTPTVVIQALARNPVCAVYWSAVWIDQLGQW